MENQEPKTVAVDALLATLAKFVDDHVVPACKTDVSRFKAGFMKPIVLSRAQAMASQYAVDGKVDAAMLKSCVMSGFDSAESVKIADFRFDRTDAEKFFSMLEAVQ